MKRTWQRAEQSALRASMLPRCLREQAASACPLTRARTALDRPAQSASLRTSTPSLQENSRDTLQLSDDTLSNPIATSWKGVKRFYTHVTVRHVESEKDANGLVQSGWQVLIQGRPLRTHAVNELYLPTEALALAIAGEFAAQGDVIRPASTPLYNLACLAVDNFLHEDLKAAEDLEALYRATRLSTWDRIEARAILQEEDDRAKGVTSSSSSARSTGSGGSSSAGDGSKGEVTTTTLSAMLEQGAGGAGAGANQGMAAAAAAAAAAAGVIIPTHAQTALTGRNDSGALSSSGSSGTAKLRDLLLDYLETDTVCYRVDWDLADPAERLLRKRQDAHYNPLLEWFHGAFGVQLGTAVGIGDVEHPDEAYAAVEDCADSADPWVKAALQSCLGTLKSSVLALALINRAIDVTGAFEASRVEEEWQIGENGFVEDGHDTTRGYVKTQLAAISTFLWLLPASAPAPLPAPGKKGYDAALAAARVARAARVQARRAREAALVSHKRTIMKAMVLEEEREAVKAKADKAKAKVEAEDKGKAE